MGDLTDFAAFMNMPTSENRYRLAREIISKELVVAAGNIFSHLVSAKQLEDMKKIDPKKTEPIDMLAIMFGHNVTDQVVPFWERYIALGQVLQELQALEINEDERINKLKGEE